MIDFNARIIDTLQSCPRRFLLESEWRVNRWRPKSLFDYCLRDAIVAIGNGTSASDAAASASARFLTLAADPGLDVWGGHDPYVIAKDHCVMLDTVIRGIARADGPPRTETPARIPISTTAYWHFSSRADASNTLHRWLTVDSWTEDALARELHSWRTVGDLAFYGSNLMLHIVEIGRMHKGRRVSMWTRGFRHPTMANLGMHFRSRTGKPLTGWKPVYLADDAYSDAESWVGQMDTEGVLRGLIHTVAVGKLPENHLQRVCDEIREEVRRAGDMFHDRALRPWHAWPMSRGACDGVTPCPWQAACYVPDASLVKLDEIGLYRRQESPSAPSSAPRQSRRQPEVLVVR